MSPNRATAALSNRTGKRLLAAEVRSMLRPKRTRLLPAKAHLPMRHPDAVTVGAIAARTVVERAMVARMETRAQTPTALRLKAARMLRAAQLTPPRLLPAIDASVKAVKMAAQMAQQPMLPLLPTTRLLRHLPATQAQVSINKVRRVMVMARPITEQRLLTPIIFR